MVVHTNDLGLANRTFASLDTDGYTAASDARGEGSAKQQSGRRPPYALRMFGPDVPLLMMMHELIFCCEALVVGTSALSSVVAWARRPKPTVAHSARDIHLSFPYITVPSH